MDVLKKMILPEALEKLLDGREDIIIPESRTQLLSLALGGEGRDFFEVEYQVPDNGVVVEATVSLCKNGAVVNYPDIYILNSRKL